MCKTYTKRINQTYRQPITNPAWTLFLRPALSCLAFPRPALLCPEPVCLAFKRFNIVQHGFLVVVFYDQNLIAFICVIGFETFKP